VHGLYASFAPVLSSAELGACGRCAKRFGSSTAGDVGLPCGFVVRATGARFFAQQGAHRSAGAGACARRVRITKKAAAARSYTRRDNSVTARAGLNGGARIKK
jgi:hypothetical protein